MSRRVLTVAVLVAAAALLLAGPASADFPYTYGGTAPNDLDDDFKLAATPDSGNGPNINNNPFENFGVRGARVADENPAVNFAFKTTTGRDDVTIAVMDSGIEWNNAGAMHDLRHKVRLTRAELPFPNHDRATSLDGGGPCTGYASGTYDANGDGAFNVTDFACDTRVSVTDPRRVSPVGVLTPQDVLIAFSDPGFTGDGPAGAGTISGGVDDDDNGFVDDIAGWDFLDNDNDAFDDVQYGHGTGEAIDSTAEANNGDGTALGTCPNCMVIPMRVGDSFIADVNRFAQGVIYATDNDVQVVQSALGTLNNSSLAREAVDYAYRHGTTSVVSAADEAAQHNNQPYLPHTILVNSVRDSNPIPATPFPPGRSYLTFNGCTNFNAKITLAIPSTSCSSNAVGNAAGFAGLVYSAAYTAHEEGVLPLFGETELCSLASPSSQDDDQCVISPNEVKQVMSSGRIDPADPADLPEGYQAEDVDFAGSPQPLSPLPPVPDVETTCSPAPLPGCTLPHGPGGALQASVDANRGTGGIPIPLIPLIRSYPARNGHDQFYGYGRVDMVKAVEAVLDDHSQPGPQPGNPDAPQIPPNVELFSPQWNEQIDPTLSAYAVRGQVWARGEDFTCRAYVAPGHYPNNRLASQTPPGDFVEVPVATDDVCDGTTLHTGALTTGDVLATIDISELKALFPPDTQELDFAGREPGVGPQQTNGRPANEAFGFVVKVVATAPDPDGAGTIPLMTGEDQRAAYLHRDQDMLPGFPRGIRRGEVVQDYPTGDGESSPAFADLDGDNDNELIFGGSDGFVHALRPDGSELPNWPVMGDQPPLHLGGRAFEEDEVPSEIGGAMLSSVAVADANFDGVPEVYAADVEGKVYGWNPEGERVFSQESNIVFSGKPLQPFENVRYRPEAPGLSKTRRTQHGFFASPVIADIDGQGPMELVIPALDRHLYAWHLDGTSDGAPVPGFPMIVVDHSRLDTTLGGGDGIDDTTHAVSFRADAGSQQQGAIVDTPAVADLVDEPGPADDGQLEIVLGTNEEYEAAADGGFNTSDVTNPVDQAGDQLSALGQQCSDNGGPGELCDQFDTANVTSPGNSRLYAIYSDGAAHPGDADGFLPGWPHKLGILLTELLPLVGEGVTGNPVVAEATCPSGGEGLKIAAQANNGPAYVLNADSTSCYGEVPGQGDNTLRSDEFANPSATDHPVLPAVGNPAFADLEGNGQMSLITPAAGLIRALDLALPEYQQTGQDYLMAWAIEPGAGGVGAGDVRANYPQQVNDLQFLTGPSVSDIDPVLPGQEVLEGTASKDLAAFSATGLQVATPGAGGTPAWPKVTTDWTVATPLVGSWGTQDTTPGAHKVVIGMTRSGYLSAYETSAGACTPSASPRFHHDNANSGFYGRDAILPGRPYEPAATATELTFRAPGDDLLCGTATRYEVVTSASPIDESNFSSALALAGAPAPASPGVTQAYVLPSGVARYIAIRAVDDQGNVGRPLVFDSGPGGGPGPGPGPGGRCSNVIRGGPRGQTLRGTAAGDRILGFRGKDRIFGLNGQDCLDGGAGNDRAAGHRGRDILRGRRGADRLFAGPGRDIVRGGLGRDRVRGGAARDRLLGGAGRDIIFARDRRRDVVRCGKGRDRAIVDRRDRVRRCEVMRFRRGR